ncbi:MAG: hypothetical protein ACTSR0_00355 [Candidatus Asgardarchaeia archaeon]
MSVAENFEREEFPSRTPAILVWLALAVMYVFGLYSIYNYLFLESPDTTYLVNLMVSYVVSLVVSNSLLVAAVTTLVLFLGFVGTILFLKGLSKIGKELTLIIMFGLPVLAVALGVIAIRFVGTYGLIFSGFGILMFLFAYIFKDRIYLAGDFIEISAKAVSSEMETVGLSLLFSIFSIVSTIMNLAVTYYVWDKYLSTINNTFIEVTISFLLILVGSWIIYSAMYIIEGATVAIIHDWYRNPSRDVAYTSKGLRKAFKYSGPIVKLGFLMAVLNTIARFARRLEVSARSERRNPFVVIGAIALSMISQIAYGLAHFITFFAVPAIIIEGYDFKNAIKRSYRVIWNNFIDVVIANSYVGLVYGVMMLIMFIFYGASGFLVGYFLFYPILPFPADPLPVSMGSAVFFILFGFIPSYLVMRPLNTAYKTILYEYALDKEALKMGKELPPSRLPESIRNRIEQIVENPRKMGRWAPPSF